MEVYQFGKRRTRKVPLKNKPVEDIEVKQPDEDAIEPVQGITPGSKEEYWVALALYRLGIGFAYQYDISGGRQFRGGQIIFKCRKLAE